MRIARTLLIALAALLAAPALAQTVPPERVLRMVPNADLQTLDPINTTAGVVSSHAHMIYDQLFGRDENQRPQPQMVASWSVSDDALTWRFTLREGLLFHDGAPVMAEDVVASLRRWGARDPHGRQIMAITEALTAEADGRSVTWRLRRPYALMLDALSKPAGNMPAIMPARVAATDPFTAITDTTGSGPFIFVRDEWVAGSRVVYRRNPAYVPRAEPASGTAGGKVAHVDRVEWLNIANAQTAVLALIQGELDYIESPGVDFLPMLQRRGMRIIRTNTLGAPGMIRMNHIHPPFDDVRARQALMLLVNQEEILQAMFPDPSLYQVCHAFFVCGSPQETDAGVPPGLGSPAARERARALLRESGYDGTPIVIMDPTDNPFVHAATLVLAQQMQQVGFRTDVQAMDFASMAGRRANRRPPSEGGWHIGLTFWNGLGASDPVGNVPMQASCERAWPGWPCDAEHQALIDAFPYAATPAERQRILTALQESAYRIVPYVPYGQWYLPSAISPRLSGVLAMPGIIIAWNVRKAAR
ncbi:ABC transporter substrate-binding protein [Neoroseomonas oryzicola]|uniref:ABC transporter substrate-binding protein n=1 Tax=Neoroseomonas oryzicola TaxID=535904 RepID=A0A9X9WFH1_9PROT|nr:ABC transporter substrate-binding protein [Neoroseomonas oryzicola]MBR0659081.1 ABC transporter substrate-binding protein [Neoroseomonas oryzicola]NKE17018.1 ABC transporter substrate-binding protein [Neoroseomonas oryzicola]